MKKIFILAIGLWLPITSLAQITNQRLFDTIPFIPDHYAKRIAAFDNETHATGQIIFLGNSITESGPWSTLIKDKPVLNRGVSGDITFGVLKRLDDIIRRQPSKLFILIGINDIGKDIPDAVIADNCKKIIDRVKKESPKTEVFLQSILPVNPTVKNFPQHYDKQEHVTATNVLLKDVAASANITFIDLHSIFRNSSNQLRDQLTYDGLHLTPAGYEVWVNHLRSKKFL